MTVETWSVNEARRRFLNVVIGSGAASVPEAVQQLGFVQEDSIDVCGRMHDLILRNRVRCYRPNQLDTALYGPDGVLFEDYLPNLCAVDRGNLRWFAHRFHARRRLAENRDSDPDERRCLDVLAERGPMRARDFEDDLRRSHSGWGTRRKVTTEVLERLWRHGRIAIAGRVGFHRVFDLPERVYGNDAVWLGTSNELPDAEESEHMLQLLALRSRPLVRASRTNHRTLKAADYAPVWIGDDPKAWWASPQIRQDTPQSNPIADQTLLIAPLDPVIYDRKLTLSLFRFDYRWEVYTPAAARRRGYYVLPILQNGCIEGWVDLQFDRGTNQLMVRNCLLSPHADERGVDDALAMFATERDTVFVRDFRWRRKENF